VASSLLDRLGEQISTMSRLGQLGPAQLGAVREHMTCSFLTV
jgi:hypothetical protein